MRITLPCPKLPTIKVPSAVEVMLSGYTSVPGSVISVTAGVAAFRLIASRSATALPACLWNGWVMVLGYNDGPGAFTFMRFLSFIAPAAMALALTSMASAQKVTTAELIQMAKTHAPGLEQALRDTLTDANIQKGAAAAGEMGEFVFAVTADKQPNLVISAPRTGDAAPVAATKVGGLWVYQGKLKTGTAYRYTWLVDGRAIGGTNDLAAFGPDSYSQPSAPQGKLSGPMVLESKIYPNMKANVWYYVPSQWD